MKWLDRKLFVSPVAYCLCTSEKQFYRELKRLKVPKGERGPFIISTHADATAHFFDATEHHQRCCIVCLRVKPGVDDLDVYALLVHEAVHIWQDIRQHIGEHYPATEQEAYAIQVISLSLMEAYKQTGGNK